MAQVAPWCEEFIRIRVEAYKLLYMQLLEAAEKKDKNKGGK